MATQRGTVESESKAHGSVGTSQGDAGGPGAEAGSTQEIKPDTKPRELSKDFQPNEPRLKTGVDDEGKPNDTLSNQQVERAVTEALLSLRPQPDATELRGVLNELTDPPKRDVHDPIAKKAREQYKTAKEAGEAGVAKLNEIRAKNVEGGRARTADHQSPENRTSDSQTSQRLTSQ
jgi:hypothetical protein